MLGSEVITLASTYVTIGDADAELEIERSRFICWLRRAETEDAARTVIAAAREAHRQANHHCSAFVVGPDAGVRRSNDDGEPAGTAGRPMLEALGHAGVSDVVAVVTRYFGGVKLGTGGLARAYSGAVTSALDAASWIDRRAVRHYALSVSHADGGRIEHALRSGGIAITGITYDREVRISLAVPVDDTALLPQLRTLGVSPGSLVETGQGWHDKLRSSQ